MTGRASDDPVAGLSRRKVLLGAAALAAAGISTAAQPRRSLDYLGKETLDGLVPERIGAWQFVQQSGLVVPPEDQLSRTLYSQLLTRVYFDGQHPPVMLLIAYSAGQTGILQIHRPEVCYPAGGYSLSQIWPQPLHVSGATIPTNTLTATAGGEAEHILYWTRVGDKLPLSWADQRLAVALANLRGLIPDAVLVRVSLRAPSRDKSMVLLREFAKDLVLSIPKSGRPVLIGRSQ